MSRLTEEQLAALANFQQLYGQRWRRELKKAWDTSTEHCFPQGAVLRQLRNSFGPAWLSAYRVGDECVGYLRQVIEIGPHVSWEIEAPDGGLMHFDLPTKTEARRRARLYKITLVEWSKV